MSPRLVETNGEYFPLKQLADRRVEVLQRMRGEQVSPAFGDERGKGKVNVETYIVRIYRRGGEDPRELVGVVEEVGVEGRRAFNNFDEFRIIFSDAPRARQREKPARRGRRHKD
jgi:hypothetical protein